MAVTNVVTATGTQLLFYGLNWICFDCGSGGRSAPKGVLKRTQMGLLEFYGKSVSTGSIVPQTSLFVRFQDMVLV